MNDDTTLDSDAIASYILRNAYADLQGKCPFLDTNALAAMLDKARTQLARDLTAKELTTTATKARFSFNKLPAELRINIYELVLTSDEDRPFETQNSARAAYIEDPTPIVRHRMPSILRVSRQIRHEALPIFYDNTHFTATFDPVRDPTSHIIDWLKMLGHSNARQIKRLSVRFLDSSPDDARFVLRRMMLPLVTPTQLSLNEQPEFTKAVVMELLHILKLGVPDGSVTVSYDQRGVIHIGQKVLD